jgi:hypothetical protein
MTTHRASNDSQHESRQRSDPRHRLEVVQVIRDGGGTAPVELVITNKLRARGHRVRLYGPPEVGRHVHAAGLDFEPLPWPPHLGSSSGDDLVPRMLAARSRGHGPCLSGSPTARMSRMSWWPTAPSSAHRWPRRSAECPASRSCPPSSSPRHRTLSRAPPNPRRPRPARRDRARRGRHSTEPVPHWACPRWPP